MLQVSPPPQGGGVTVPTGNKRCQHLSPIPCPLRGGPKQRRKEKKLPRQFGVRSGIPRAIVWAGAWTVTGHPGRTKDFQPPYLKSSCEKGGLTKTAPDHCRWDSTNKIQQIHLHLNKVIRSAETSVWNLSQQTHWMGCKLSKEVGPPEGPIVEIMRKKCWDKSLKDMNVLTTEFGFPTGESLSLKNISKLEEKLKAKEQKIRRKNEVSVRKSELIKGQKECLQMWKTEAEIRNTKLMQKQLPFSCEKVETIEKPDSHKQRTQNLQISSSLFPQLAALKLDSDLDGNPPSHPSAPPPYNSATPNERREADSIRLQLQPSSKTARSEMPGPSQDSTTNSLSPIAHRPWQSNKDTAFNMPMVEVSGPQGATLVFLPLRTSQPLHIICSTPQHQEHGHRYPGHREKGRGHYKNWERKLRKDVRFLCGQSGHWRRNCPKNTSSDAINIQTDVGWGLSERNRLLLTSRTNL
ncbi:uncharacterized protein LOC127360787 [Xyrichtys novacula]|uniref:Uncharacterized protein LOC127360787 n=1 Tax=Xyrichtys novacula TaxID=13765 RepID=A0AAV1F2Y3_XYRNO|nr:uncharacterized protein LOC127360787 [Xyrichtys novacula]